MPTRSFLGGPNQKTLQNVHHIYWGSKVARGGGVVRSRSQTRKIQAEMRCRLTPKGTVYSNWHLVAQTEATGA